MLKLFFCLFGCLFSCFASVYALTLDDLISFEERGTDVRGRLNHIRYKFRLAKKVSKNSGIFIVEIEQSLLKALIDQDQVHVMPGLPEYEAWLHSGAGGSRIFKLIVTYAETRKRRGRREKAVPTQKIKDMVRHIIDESWKDNKNAKAKMERTIRKAEKVYIEGIDLTDAVVGRVIEFPREASLYRVGLRQGYPKFTFSRKEAGQELKKANEID